MEAVRQCQVAISVSERVREYYLRDSRLFSTGSVIILYHVALINAPQQCSELDGASAELTAPDEGIRSSHVVEGFEVAHAPIRRETSRLRGGRIAVDDAHLFIGPPYTHTGKLEGALCLIRTNPLTNL